MERRVNRDIADGNSVKPLFEMSLARYIASKSRNTSVAANVSVRGGEEMPRPPVVAVWRWSLTGRCTAGSSFTRNNGDE